jgi:hypothetical protein
MKTKSAKRKTFVFLSISETHLVSSRHNLNYDLIPIMLDDSAGDLATIVCEEDLLAWLQLGIVDTSESIANHLFAAELADDPTMCSKCRVWIEANCVACVGREMNDILIVSLLARCPYTDNACGIVETILEVECTDTHSYD